MLSAMEQVLSARECDVLGLIAHGYKTSEIAALLDIEECTVRFHIKNILGVLDVSTHVAAVYCAVKSGWIR